MKKTSRIKCVKKKEFKEKEEMMNGLSVGMMYDTLLIIPNFYVLQRHGSDFDSKKWYDECKKISPGYVMDTRFMENKTIIVGYQMKTSYLLPLDVFCNQYTIIIPRTMVDFVETVYEKLVMYILSQMKKECSWKIVNQVKYSIHMYFSQGNPAIEKMRGTPYVIHHGLESQRETVLGKTLTENMVHIEFPIMINEMWNILPTQSQIKNSAMDIS